MRIKRALNLTALLLFMLPLQACGQSCLCDPVPARNVGALLTRSSPLVEASQDSLNEYGNWIATNSHLLDQNGPTMQCARDLGVALVNQGLHSYSRADYDGAYGRVLGMGGSMADAHSVAGSMTSGALDAFMTGKEMVWLSLVIPEAAQGNWDPFMSTGTESRQAVRQAIQIYGMAGMGGALQQLQPFINQFGPMVEDQTVMAACLFTD